MKKILICACILTALSISSDVLAGPVISRPPVNIPASESSSGIVALATDAETIAGTDTGKAITPADLRAVILDDMADAALSGSPVILGIKDKDGNIYYFKAYPTKN